MLRYLRTGGTRGRWIAVWLVFHLPRDMRIVRRVRFELLMFLRPIPKDDP